ncbi:UNVERIFIED_CONTAM: hypothetical protein PYX00_006242 [Menopon gallinae]|uniref:Uncharacterized protein n=1 Tax=Menopon gallinae TaxID=328185 RepID=A0AAW2HWH8_9NEOP
MEFIRSCIFPHQTLWRAPVRIHGAGGEHDCNCAVLDKVNEAIQTYFRKGTLTELTKEELEFLPYEVLKRSARREIHLVWDRLSDHAQLHLQDHRICEKHPVPESADQLDGPRPLIIDCWYCRAERESEEAKAKDDNIKF